MGKLIVQEWVSLDGFAADKNDSTDFFRDISPEQVKSSQEDQIKLLQSIDLILLGRKTYELFIGYWPDATTEQEIISEPINKIKKIVFSNTLKSAPWGKWAAAEVSSGDAVQNIKTLKENRNLIVWGSITLVQALLENDLVDEFHLSLCPKLLGAGKPMFGSVPDERNFKLIDSKTYETGYIFLNYARKK